MGRWNIRHSNAKSVDKLSPPINRQHGSRPSVNEYLTASLLNLQSTTALCFRNESERRTRRKLDRHTPWLKPYLCRHLTSIEILAYLMHVIRWLAIKSVEPH